MDTTQDKKYINVSNDLYYVGEGDTYLGKSIYQEITEIEPEFFMSSFNYTMDFEKSYYFNAYAKLTEIISTQINNIRNQKHTTKENVTYFIDEMINFIVDTNLSATLFIFLGIDLCCSNKLFSINITSNNFELCNNEKIYKYYCRWKSKSTILFVFYIDKEIEEGNLK
jgi:hypothetical protein